DGDTPSDARRWIRENSRWIVTNPDMLHLSLLGRSRQWTRLLRGLCFVVVDEGHCYRGVFGSNVALVLRRRGRRARAPRGPPLRRRARRRAARGPAPRGGPRRRPAAGRAPGGAVGAAADGRGDRGERGAGAQARAGRGLGAHGVVGGRGRPDVDVRALAGGGRVRRPAGPGAALLRSRGAGPRAGRTDRRLPLRLPGRRPPAPRARPGRGRAGG